MAKEVIGHISCPDCGYSDAEVKETKKVYQGKPFVMVWCPHPKCQTQTFPRSKDACERIRAKMRPVGEPQPAPTPEAKPAPKAEPTAPAKTVRKSLAEELGI